MIRVPIHPRKRQKIFERDNFKCVNCGSLGDFNCLEVDHIVGIKDGGSNDDENLQTLCYKCNMNKYYKKNITDKFFLDLSPLKRLDLIKERLESYKHLTYSEFKVVFTQDELFKRLRINLMYIEDLFRDISGKKRKIDSNGMSIRKYTQQRNIIIKILKRETNKSLKELEILLGKEGIVLSFQQISKICSRIKDFSVKND